MNLTEFLMFNGGPDKFEEYQKLLAKRDRLRARITGLSNKVFDEEDSLSVFTGELSERDKELYSKHLEAKEEYEQKRDRTYERLYDIERKIHEMQMGW